MIRQPRNWNEVQEFSDAAKLPLDAYVCKVKQAEVQGEQLCIAFDIAEGAQAGFFKRAFAQDNRDGKKWKGVLRLWLPSDDGTERDEWTKRTLKGAVTAFEKSNNGYKWNWNEQSLAGLMVGILFRNEEWELDNGKTGWSVRPFRAMAVEKVRSGDYTLPNDKPLKKSSSGYAGGYGGFATPSYSSGDFAQLDDDDAQLPF